MKSMGPISLGLTCCLCFLAACHDSHGETGGGPDAEALDAESGVGLDGGATRIDGSSPDGSAEDPRSIGEPCADGSECESGTCATFPWYAGGLCTQRCSGDAECPDGSSCTAAVGGVGECLAHCGVSDDGTAVCRAGFTCTDRLASEPVCTSGCTVEEDCREGTSCDPERLECFSEGSAIGDPCRWDDECPAGSRCFSESFLGFPGGMCSRMFCGSGPDCPAGSVCTEPALVGIGGCLRRCEGGDDCRVGYECRTATSAGDGACVPGCSNAGNCSDPDHVCNLGTGLCNVPFDPDLLGMRCDVFDSLEDPCPGGVCLSTDGANGFCALLGCRADGPSVSCPDDAVCIELSAELDYGACVPPCESGTDCLPGHVCEPLAEGSGGGCRPP